jgi:hypothetical protein
MAADWYEAEPPLFSVLVAELQRLKRRAQARWWLVVLVGVALTGAVLWKMSRKPTMYRAQIILAITEGEMNYGHVATPLGELRDYIGSVLLSNGAIVDMLKEKDWMADERELFGDEVVVMEIRDSLGIGVWRNYFQYSWSYDERRTARVALVYTSIDRDFAYEMVRALTNIVITREGERRAELAQALARQSVAVLDAARARLNAARSEALRAAGDVALAEEHHDAGQAAIARIHVTDAATEMRRAEEAFFAIEQTTTAESLEAAVTAAGLALEMQVVSDRKPPEHERSTVVLIGTALVALCIFLPLAGIVIGAFDARVHDLDDVERLDLHLLGHIPTFPGDSVGALRDRGVRLRRVPFWWPWP